VIALLKASAGRRDIISFVVALLMALAIGALIILVTEQIRSSPTGLG